MNTISIIIVTFNAAKTIQAAINSVITQNYPKKELIIIDGNSNDDTVKIISNMGNSITHFVSEPDNGIYDAMNKGIAAATGDWLLFLGADDVLNKNILQEVFANESTFLGIQLLYGKVTILGTKHYQGAATTYLQLIENNIPHQGIFYHKTIFNTINGYHLPYKILADYYLNLKIFECGLFNTTFINTTIVTFNSKGVSNRTIDFLFFSNQLVYFIQEKSIHKNNPILAKYYFFIGVALILKKQYYTGTIHLLKSLYISKKKWHYCMLMVDFVLSKMYVRKNYTLVES